MKRIAVAPRRIVSALVISIVLAGVLQPSAAGASADAPRPVKVMTRNLYLGADLAPVFGAPDVPTLLAVAAQQFQKVQATNFPARAVALAREIQDADPALVGLQEVSLWRRGASGVLDGPVTPATTVVYDFLPILMDALAARGLAYRVVISQFTSDGEVPTALGFDVRLTQRNVILAKAGLPSSELSITQTDGAIFATNLTIPTVGGPVVDRRGWISADATVNKRSFRFITTHLDSTHPGIRQAQALELSAGPANTSRPVILVGDLNSAPGEAAPSAYAELLGTGFVDTWVQANPGDPGLTCCHAESLLNPAPAFTTRIDHVLSRPGVTVARSKRVGIDTDNRTPAGLWPSDHAGIIATLAP